MNNNGYIPRVRIKHAWLLTDQASSHLHKLWAKEGEQLMSSEKVQEIVDSYAREWSKYENIIVPAMCETLDLKFRKNIIDVHIAPWFNAFSKPLIIGVKRTPDEFVDVLTHELLHVLLTDNTKLPENLPEDQKLRVKWRKMFGKTQSFVTTVHIPVHAVHKKIYLDILAAPERYSRDIERVEERGAEAYVKSWEYVEKERYKEIIEKLKLMYNEYAN